MSSSPIQVFVFIPYIDSNPGFGLRIVAARSLLFIALASTTGAFVPSGRHAWSLFGVSLSTLSVGVVEPC